MQVKAVKENFRQPGEFINFFAFATKSRIFASNEKNIL